MNKTLTTMAGIVALAVMASPASAFFGLGNTTNDAPTQESTFYYVEAAGSDLRAYEWRKVTSPTTLCIAVFSSGSGPVGTQCFNTAMADPILADMSSTSARTSTGYKVEARGWNVRVYEWNMINAPSVSCIAMFSNAGNAGLECNEAD